MKKKKIVPEVPEVLLEGNTSNKTTTKQISCAKFWCFTLNNYTEEEISSIVPIIKELCNKGGFGKEIAPTTGTPHLQGFLSFKEKCRPFGIFNNPRIQFKKCKGNLQQNVNYISKENIFFSWGLPKKIKIITELRPWQKLIEDEIKLEPDDRKIMWVYDKKGNQGKTSLCKYLTVMYKAICLGGKAADCRNGIVEYMKSHEGITPNIVLINIPRSFNSDYLSYEGLENIKDMYFYSGKYEGGQVCGNSPHLIIFSNELPDKEKITEDRWNIITLGDEYSLTIKRKKIKEI